MRHVLLALAVVGVVLTAGCAEALDEVDADIKADDAATEADDAPTETDDAPDNDDGDGVGVDVDGELEIHHVDVGQADATLVITPEGETILVDTGDWRQDGTGVIAYLDDHDVDRIDHLVATHGHADHIGGHAAIIERYETELDGIGAAYDSGVAHTSQTYGNYLDAIEEHGVELFEVEADDELPLADDAVTATVHNPPPGDSGSGLHENSVTLTIEFGDATYLTTGDAERAAEERMVEQRGDVLEADVYQAGHHGSSTSSTSTFMDVVDPEIAVISSGFESQYGHPHDEVLERFADRRIETYWTGVHGDIVVTTDGESVDVATSEEASTDPAALLEMKPEDDDGTDAIDADAVPAPSLHAEAPHAEAEAPHAGPPHVEVTP